MVQAVIGELGGQGVRVTSKCLWDSDNDNFASYTYVNVRRRAEPLEWDVLHGDGVRDLLRVIDGSFSII